MRDDRRAVHHSEGDRYRLILLAMLYRLLNRASQAAQLHDASGAPVSTTLRSVLASMTVIRIRRSMAPLPSSLQDRAIAEHGLDAIFDAITRRMGQDIALPGPVHVDATEARKAQRGAEAPSDLILGLDMKLARGRHGRWPPHHAGAGGFP